MVELVTAGISRIWLYLAGAALGLALIFCSLWLTYSHGLSVKDAEWQARWNARDAGDQQAWGLEQEQARTEEQRRQAAVNEVSKDARKDQVAAIADAVHADAAGDRLHVAANDLATRASCPASDPGAADRSQAARRAAMVLSDLLARADKRAGELAKAYDGARIAGLACERSYGSLTR